MGWFEENARERVSGQRPAGTLATVTSPGQYVPETGGGEPMPSLQNRIWQMLAQVSPTASPQALASIEPQLRQMGVTLQRNSQGEIRGRLYLPGGQIMDVVNAQQSWGGPWATSGGASGGGGTDPQAYFQSLIQGRPGTPETLLGLEPQLAQQGIRVLRNAAGVAGKIQLPSGQIVDVIRAAGTGGGADNWQWLTGDGGGASGGEAWGGALPEGYAMGTYTGGGQYPLSSVMAPGLNAPWTTPFKAPDDVTQQNDPGWAFRMSEGLKAIERSAAAKGTLLSGGTLKDLTRWSQDYASNEYDKVYGRALGEYQQAYGIYRNNQNDIYGRLFGTAGLGQNAAAQTGNNATNYANTAGNLMTGIGNANAAGQVGSANAWAGGINNLGQLPLLYTVLKQPPVANPGATG